MTIKGSPRQESNSHLLLTKVLAGLKDANQTEEISLNTIEPAKLAIKPCQACFACDKDGHCVIKDDMQGLYREFDKADIILVSAPVFFNGLPAQLKAMIDRCQALWASKYQADKPVIDTDKDRKGFLLAVGGSSAYPDQFIAIDKVIKMFFRVVNADYVKKLAISDTDNNPVRERGSLLDKAYQLGQSIKLAE